MSELGATCFYECKEADAVEDQDAMIDAWTDGIWAPLQKAYAAVQVGSYCCTALINQHGTGRPNKAAYQMQHMIQ
jgi:hypothetical protein